MAQKIINYFKAEVAAMKEWLNKQVGAADHQSTGEGDAPARRRDTPDTAGV